MFCRQCGRIIPADSAFCPECGAPTKNTQPTQTVQRQDRPVQSQPRQFEQEVPVRSRPAQTHERGNKDQVVVKCRKHWGMFVGRGIVAFLFLISAFVAETGDSTARIVCFSVAALIMLPAVISYFSDYLELTETKIIGHSGLINSRKISAPLSKVQNIELSNGLGGKIFGYHNIVVDNAGTAGKEFRFTKATNAEEFAEAVYARMR